MSTCLEVGMKVRNKYIQNFQSNTSKGIGNNWGGTKNLTKIQRWKKGHIFVNIHDKSFVLLSRSGNDGHYQVVTKF
jgi:hypothetical protein